MITCGCAVAASTKYSTHVTHTHIHQRAHTRTNLTHTRNGFIRGTNYKVEWLLRTHINIYVYIYMHSRDEMHSVHVDKLAADILQILLRRGEFAQLNRLLLLGERKTFRHPEVQHTYKHTHIYTYIMLCNIVLSCGGPSSSDNASPPGSYSSESVANIIQIRFHQFTPENYKFYLMLLYRHNIRAHVPRAYYMTMGITGTYLLNIIY